MLLVREKSDADVWTARTGVCAEPDEVLRALTDPEAIADWAPVRFDVEGLSGGRLRTGSHERVSGTIAGVRATFDIEVMSADQRRLELVAKGPLSFDVAYSFVPDEHGVTVEAQVGVRRQRGLTAQVLRAAVAALLNAGALSCALRKLDASVSRARAASAACVPEPAPRFYEPTPQLLAA